MKNKFARKLPPELIQLEESVGHFMHYWGFKKIHGRIWAHLFTSTQPLDAQELIDRLKVSKGLISLAVRDLLDHEVIQYAHTGRHGTVYYCANPDLASVITKVLRKREAVMLATARQAVESLLRLRPAEVAEHSLSSPKIKVIEEMVSSAQGLLSALLMNNNQSDGAIFDRVTVKEKS